MGAPERTRRSRARPMMFLLDFAMADHQDNSVGYPSRIAGVGHRKDWRRVDDDMRIEISDFMEQGGMDSELSISVGNGGTGPLARMSRLGISGTRCTASSKVDVCQAVSIQVALRPNR